MTIKHITTKKEFLDTINSETKTIIVKFTATWCGPCKFIAPIYKECSEKYLNIVFLEVDVDAVPDVTEMCEVSAMPTFKIIKNRKIIDGFSGATEVKLKSLLNKY